MKKLIILFTFLFYGIQANACLPYTEYDYIIGKIKNVNDNNIILDNYINNKFLDQDLYSNILNFIKDRNGLMNKSIFTYGSSDCLKKTQDTLDIENKKLILKKGNIIYFTKNINNGINNIDRIYLVRCINNKIYIGKNYFKKLDNKVGGCSGLNTFFDKDRTFEDLEGNKLKYLSYYKNIIDYKFYYILILFFIILGFLIYNLGKK